METEEAFTAFLHWLGNNAASGARKYEEVRQRLVLLFRCRGCPCPDELADRTIDRTAQAIMKPGFAYEGDPIAYFRGVANNIYREWLREERRFKQEPLSDIHLDREDSNSQDDKERISACLELCLKTLPNTKRELLLRYYLNDKSAKIDGRQLLAQEQGIGLNALRIQVFRLRNLLRSCVENCIVRHEIKGATASYQVRAN